MIFRNVPKDQLYPSDKLFHRFLWRDLEFSKLPDVYEFNSLVFGVNASPFFGTVVHMYLNFV